MASLAFLTIILGVGVSLARYVRASSADQITRTLLQSIDRTLATNEVGGDPPPPNVSDESTWAAYLSATNERVLQPLLRTDGPVLDAWGNPVGYLSAAKPEIGMAPHDRSFCFSAGPDGRYLTLEDNLYSYEQINPPPVATQPTGQRE